MKLKKALGSIYFLYTAVKISLVTKNYKLDVGSGKGITMIFITIKKFQLPKYCQTEIISLNDSILLIKQM